jgi:hypothetical protein
MLFDSSVAAPPKVSWPSSKLYVMTEREPSDAAEPNRPSVVGHWMKRFVRWYAKFGQQRKQMPTTPGTKRMIGGPDSDAAIV